jgi:hypothetical protein
LDLRDADLAIVDIHAVAFRTSAREEGDMFARHVTLRGDPGRIDEVLRAQHDVVLPVLRECAGFVAQLVLMDRVTGEAIGVSVWDTEENMNASEEKVSAARQHVADSIKADAPAEVRLYELPIFEQA